MFCIFGDEKKIKLVLVEKNSAKAELPREKL